MSRSKEEKQYERKQRKKLEKEKEKQKADRVDSFLERKKDPNYGKPHFYVPAFNPSHAKGCLKILLLLLIPFIIIFWAYVSGNPEMKTFRESLFWIVGSKSVISIFLIYLGFFAKEKHGFIGKLAFSFAAAFPWFNLAVSDNRISYIALVTVFILFAISVSWNLFFKERICLFSGLISTWFLFLLVKVRTIANMSEYPPKYYIIPLLFGGICFLLISFLYEKGYIYIPSKKPSSILFEVFIFSFAALFFIMPAANYMFDTSEGNSQILRIKDKAQHNTRIRRYFILVNYHGETIEIQIPFDEYNLLEIGDTVTVTQYEGFLGDEYVIVND